MVVTLIGEISNITYTYESTYAYTFLWIFKERRSYLCPPAWSGTLRKEFFCFHCEEADVGLTGNGWEGARNQPYKC